jgi:hypothetical protein
MYASAYRTFDAVADIIKLDANVELHFAANGIYELDSIQVNITLTGFVRIGNIIVVHLPHISSAGVVNVTLPCSSNLLNTSAVFNPASNQLHIHVLNNSYPSYYAFSQVYTVASFLLDASQSVDCMR